jgi:hypothetical protein
MKRVAATKDSVLKMEAYMMRRGLVAKKAVWLDCEFFFRRLSEELSQVLPLLIVFEDFGSIL